MILASVHNLAKGFAGRTLFERVSFGLEDGDRTGLVGPNGAGKSTLLRLIAGQLEPDAGSVSRKKGLRLGFLEQVPTFSADATIMSALLSAADDLGRAFELISRLELGSFGAEFPVDQLSGGWKKRVALARELMGSPELLLLDEPTNHLDVSGILWLERFLSTAPFATLMITHDRLFLQRVVNHVLDLDPRNPNYLLDVRGDYLQYVESKELELAALARQERVLRNTLRREKEWLARGAQARQTKQRARSESAHELADEVSALTQKNQAARVQLGFGAGENAPKKLIEVKGLGKSYDERVLFESVDLLITPRTRLALLGDNGSGKSTLIKILLGREEPSTGSMVRADKLEVAYFEQSRETVDPELSVLRNVCPEGDYVNHQGQFLHVRSYLDRFLFKGDKVDLPAAKLSGGEQARLRLAQLMLRPAQVLVLDEPTNDLDAETLEVLEEALKGFGGAVILVTHDRYFMDAVADDLLAFPLLREPSRRLERFASYYQWEEWFTQRQKELREPGRSKAAEATKPAARVKLSFKEKFELEKMEETILKLETEIERLTAESQEPRVLANHNETARVLGRLAEVQAELDGKFERWAELEAKTNG